MSSRLPPAFALNQRTVASLPFREFLDLARRLGCIGIEPRTDLGRKAFDGLAPIEAGRIARDQGLRLLGVSEVYPFDDWNDERRDAVRRLIDIAAGAGAETISLIPRVDGLSPVGPGRQALHREIFEEIETMLPNGLIALVEPIGFKNCSIRHQSDAVAALPSPRFGIVHDTFQHSLAQDQDLLVDRIKIVHISGVPVPPEELSDAHDGQRVLVGSEDRTGVVDQIRRLLDAGYSGAFSYETTVPGLLDDPEAEQVIGASIDYIRSAVAQ